jgi:hypothetical protein
VVDETHPWDPAKVNISKSLFIGFIYLDDKLYTVISVLRPGVEEGHPSLLRNTFWDIIFYKIKA